MYDYSWHNYMEQQKVNSSNEADFTPLHEYETFYMIKYSFGICKIVLFAKKP